MSKFNLKKYSENKGPKMDTLKKNKVSLTEEERKKVMSTGAVWHHGPHGEATPAVWKTKQDDGNFLYITNTHRAGAVENSLKAAINKYHSFIKSTA